MNLRKGGSCGKGQERMGVRDTIKLKLSSGQGLDLRHKMTLEFCLEGECCLQQKEVTEVDLRKGM